MLGGWRVRELGWAGGWASVRTFWVPAVLGLLLESFL